MKLSSTQEKILTLMRNGWELGDSLGYDYYGRIQKGGLGKGGEVITVNSATIRALWTRNLIKVKTDIYPTRVFELASQEVK